MSDLEPAEVPEAPETSAVEPETIPDGIMAMTSDSGLVVTLLQKDENGPVYRHGGEWVPVVDPSAFDGLTFVGVDEDSVETYDNHESSDLLVPISEYTPSMGGPFWPDVVEPSGDENNVLDEETGIYGPPVDGSEEDEEGGEVGPSEDDEDDESEEEAVTASILLDSEEDLTAAVAAAVDDPDLRWYVERRVEALGLEASLPWLHH